MIDPSDDSLLAALHRTLKWTRSHVLTAVAGLDAPALTCSYVASGWTPLNLIRHLTIDVERFWFNAVIAGQADAIAWFESTTTSGWRQPVADPINVFTDYRTQCAASDQVIKSLPLSAQPTWWPRTATEEPPHDLAKVLVHVLVDTATHAGHLDLVREAIDGRQFLVVDR